MFSFVDIRLALLLSATVLLARGQGEDDSKYHFQTLIWVVFGALAPSGCGQPAKDAEQFAGADRPLRDTRLQWADMVKVVTQWGALVVSLETWKRVGIYRLDFFHYWLLLSLACRYMLSVRPPAGVQTWREQLHCVWCAVTGQWFHEIWSKFR